MTALQEAEKLLPALSRAEKAQLLQWVINDLSESFPGIESRAGVCGGEPCIVRTRIPGLGVGTDAQIGHRRSGYFAQLPHTSRRRFGARVGLCARASRRNRATN